MFLPIRTDYRPTARPWVNYGLIAANVVVFLAGFHSPNPAIERWMLHPDLPRLGQFFTSMFLHANWMHLLGNMVFLWVFGNAVNDRFGHTAYLAFYLAGGVLSGIGYVLLSGQAPVLGASGAISAVTGAYLVLLPRVRVQVLVIFYFITTMEISGLYFVGFNLVWNLLMTLTDWLGPGAGGGVAYAAHSSGYLYGMAVAGAMLALRLMPRTPQDLPSMIRRRLRRPVSTGARSPYGPAWDSQVGPFGPPRPPFGQPSRWVQVRKVDSSEPDSPAARELALRREIASACAANDMPAAAEKYLRLLQVADDAVLSRANQLDVANHLTAAGRYVEAADAYERFLRHYGTYEHAADVELMLGLIYGRYLHQYDRAESHLERAAQRLHDPRKVAQATEELNSLRRRGR